MVDSRLWTAPYRQVFLDSLPVRPEAVSPGQLVPDAAAWLDGEVVETAAEMSLPDGTNDRRIDRSPMDR